MKMLDSVIPVLRHCMSLVLHEGRSHDRPTGPACFPVMNCTTNGRQGISVVPRRFRLALTGQWRTGDGFRPPSSPNLLVVGAGTRKSGKS